MEPPGWTLFPALGCPTPGGSSATLGGLECLVKFKVEFVYTHKHGAYLFARRLEDCDFSVSASSRLSGVPLQPHLSQPRKIKPDGSPDLDVFAFILARREDGEKFALGQIVELEP
jgi:hypothetical protein